MAGRAVRNTIVPDKDEHEQLERLAHALGGKLASKTPRIRSAGQELALPPSALDVLRRAVIELACGNGVAVLPVAAELSTEEAAAALGLGIPALKARLLRGRLMLREALAPHFAVSTPKGSAEVGTP